MSSTNFRGRVVILAGAFIYFAAVVSRSSIGAAAIDAQQKFEVSAAVLSSLAVAQLVVYAAMQVPVGILLDRFGSKRLILVGALIMSLGQSTVAISQTIELAVVGRMLVGLGDAFIFISLVRLVNGWYQGKQATRVQQLVTNVGQLGQAASAIPFSLLLHFAGWLPSFTALALLLMIAAALGWRVISNDRPNVHDSQRVSSVGQAIMALRENLKHPGVWLSFWTHFSTQSASSIFLLLWGMPFLVLGQGLSKPDAAIMLASIVVIGFAAGPAVSAFCVRWPDQRHKLVLGVMSAIGLTLSAILLWQQTAPLWLLWLLITSLGVSSPVSMVAFDFSRSFVTKKSLGAVNGFVNIGGFTATFVMMFIAGVVLDYIRRVTSSNQIFTLQGFRYALLVELVTLVAGAILILRAHRRLRSSKKNQSLNWNNSGRPGL